MTPGQRALAATRLQSTRATWFVQRANTSRRRFWNSSMLVIALVVLDVTGYFIGPSAGRYLLVALAIFFVSIARTPTSRLTIRRLELPDVFVLVLFLYGIVGSIYGIAFSHTANPALALFVPLLLALLHLTTLGSVQEDEALTYLRRLSFIGAAYVAVFAADGLVLLNKFQGGVADPTKNVASVLFGHEKAFLVCLGLAAAWMRGRRALFLVLFAVSAITFLTYPAATYLVAGAIAFITLIGTSRTSGRPRRYALLLLGIVLLGLIVSEVTNAGPATQAKSSHSSISSTYFSAVGKTNNNETRAQLWSIAWSNFWKSPLYGSAFTADTTVPVKLSGKASQVPVHNDFLQMGMGGGLIGMGLLGAWVISANAAAVGRLRRLRADGRPNATALLRVLLVGYNGFFAVAFLNPVMSRFGLSVVAMLLYSMMMTIGMPALATQAVPAA